MKGRSGLGRPIDPSYPSNLYAVAAMFAAGAAGSVVAFVAGSGVPESLGWGVLTGGAAFLAWAIGREIDPDRTSTAAVAAPLAAAAVAAGRPSLWSAAAALLAARVLVRSTGVPPKPADLATVTVVAAGAAGTSAAGLPVGLIAAAGLVLDRILPRPAPRRVVAGGAIAAGAAIAAAAAWGMPAPDPVAFSAGELVVASLAGLGCLAVLAPSRPRSAGDYTGEPLLGVRLLAARSATAAAVIGAAAWAGGPGAVAMAPAGAALLAVLIPRVRRVAT
jgi:hypothetical protein